MSRWGRRGGSADEVWFGRRGRQVSLKELTIHGEHGAGDPTAERQPCPDDVVATTGRGRLRSAYGNDRRVRFARIFTLLILSYGLGTVAVPAGLIATDPSRALEDERAPLRPLRRWRALEQRLASTVGSLSDVVKMRGWRRARTS